MLCFPLGGDLDIQMINSGITEVQTGGNISVSIGHNLSADQIIADLTNFGDGIIGTGGNLNFSVGGNLTASGVTLDIDNSDSGDITTGGNLTFHVGNNFTKTGSATLSILNNGSGHIGTGGNITGTINGSVNGGDLNATINNNNGGTIDNGGNISLTISGISAGGLTLLVDNSAGGHIGTGGNIVFTTEGDLSADSINALINNRNGGTIESGGNMTFNIGGALTTQGDATFVISNRDDGSGGGTIGSNVDLTLDATSISTGGILVTDVSTNRGGHIMGSVHNTVGAAGLLSAGTLDFEIENAGFDSGGGFAPGGTIDSNAILSVTASDISTTSDYFNQIISNAGGGHIGGNAAVNVVASSMDVATDAYFNISNSQNGEGTPAGSIGGDAAIQVNVGNMLVGGLIDAEIDNFGGGTIGDGLIGDGTTGANATITLTAASLNAGNSLEAYIFNYNDSSIAGSALINFTVSGNIFTQGDANFTIDNSADDSEFGGTIGSDAAINLTAQNLTADNAFFQIVNNGGSIGGSATVNMNVSGNVSVTNDATAAIYGSDGAASAAINFNGGSYDAGGTFLSYIDGNGTITFNNASAHADVLKAGAFGPNGVLNVGGGTLSGDTTLKLYAPGSNGAINFVSNVTLDSNSSVIIAGNTVTINNGVMVTITGDDGIHASVFTNVPNYTGSGGNGSTSGVFAGNGADTLPLGQAPPFGNPPRPATTVPPGGNVPHRPRPGVINVTSTEQLLALLDRAVPGRGGRITIPASRTPGNGRNASRINAAARLSADRRAANSGTTSSMPARRLLQ